MCHFCEVAKIFSFTDDVSITSKRARRFLYSLSHILIDYLNHKSMYL